MALAPAAIHAQEHLGPVLAFGAAGAGIDFDIGVIGVGLAREERSYLVAVSSLGELGEAANSVLDQIVVAFAFG
jgi:hypothetical protein